MFYFSFDSIVILALILQILFLNYFYLTVVSPAYFISDILELGTLSRFDQSYICNLLYFCIKWQLKTVLFSWSHIACKALA